MIVADTNVIAAVYLTTVESPLVERIIDSDSEWIAPRLWRSEFRNVLALYIRRELLELADAILVMARTQEFMRGGEYDVHSSPVLRLAQTSGCTAYDCEFVALALDRGVQLLTFDQQLLSRFAETAISPEDYLRSHGSHRN